MTINIQKTLKCFTANIKSQLDSLCMFSVLAFLHVKFWLSFPAPLLGESKRTTSS